MNESEIRRRHEKLKDLDARVFVEIPLQEIKGQEEYRRRIVELEREWMNGFNTNPHYRVHSDFWNTDEGGIGGNFGEEYVDHSKFYRFDGARQSMRSGTYDYTSLRGFLIRDHDTTPWDFVKVHLIADNLCVYLTKKGIKHRRVNFDRGKNPILT